MVSENTVAPSFHINTEDQNWRSDKQITPTDEELADVAKSVMWVDWIRVYRAVDESGNGT